MRKNFEMTEEDLRVLLDSMRPSPMIALQCGAPQSVQERANAAWASLGKKMGFDFMTVTPSGGGQRFFSAIAIAVVKPHLRKDGDMWCATWPTFSNLQESPAGFGETPEIAIAMLGEPS